jgi:hypothetical protein
MNAARLLGATLVCDDQGRPERVDLQFLTVDEGGLFQQVRMDFPNALFVLSCLRSIQFDTETPFPEYPRP